MRKAGILIVDDEPSVRDSLAAWFRRDGYRVEVAENAEAALRRLDESDYDVVLLDIRMPGMDGMELQRQLREKRPELAVIMITAFASVDTAVRALKEGAFDYVTKPFEPDELGHLVRRAVEARELREENERLKNQVTDLVGPDTIIGETPPMKRLVELVHQVAPTEATVLVRGESGTGKELVARAIHAGSPRRFFPIVPVNCGALPDSLLESELFGHEKGAFTGAQFRRKGRFEMANGGTLFLDEIGTVSAKMQVELLRVLETKEVTRVGGTVPVAVDFRLVCATNHDLEDAVRQGQLREDLYYRINVFTVDVPPLRERAEDIPLLAMHFLRRLAAQMSKPFEGFDDDAMARMKKHDWPGNVRELANAIERAAVVGAPPHIRVRDLPLPARSSAGRNGDRLEDIECRHIATILERTGGNVSRSAEILDIDRATLYNKIKRYGLRH